MPFALRLDPQHLAAQVVGVGRGALGVVLRVAVGPLVDRRVAGSTRTGWCRRRWSGRGCRPRRSRCRRRRGSTCPRSLATCSTTRSLAMLRVSSALRVNRDRCRCPFHGVEVGRRAGGRRVTARRAQRRRVVEVDEPVGGEAGVDGDALQALLVVGVDRELPATLVLPATSVTRTVPLRAVWSDRAVGQHGQRHRLAELGRADGERDLLVVGGRDRAAALGCGARQRRRRERCRPARRTRRSRSMDILPGWGVKHRRPRAPTASSRTGSGRAGCRRPARTGRCR